MKIDLVCAGACRDNGKPTQIAGCGVIIILTDDYDRVQSREFGWALGNSSSNLANIQAARLGLSSVLPQFRGNETLLHMSSKFVVDLLKTEIVPKKNIDEISELRRWFSYYPEIVAHTFNDGHIDVETIKRVKDLAKTALERQEHFDSGTVGLDGTK